MLEPDAGFSIKHAKPTPPAPTASSLQAPDLPTTPPSTPLPDSNPNPTPAPLPRPTFAELKKTFADAVSSETVTQPTSQPSPQTIPAPNIQTIQTSDPNFVVTKNLDAASVFSTAAPTAAFDSPEKSPEPTTSLNEPPKPAIELSNPMAPRPLFEEPTPATNPPSVAFNDPATAPDAPKPGTDPGAKKGLDASDLKKIKDKLNTPTVKQAASSAKANPMRALLIVSSIIIIILIIAISLVS